jgi:3-dehydroquinate dehydratase II
MKILIINGPNLNLLGTREPEVYGNRGLTALENMLKSNYTDIQFEFFQSNLEGEIINALHNTEKYNGIILNAGGYTHTSVAIGDAVKAIKTPVVEVHLSNTLNREEYRHTSMVSAGAEGVIMGFGFYSYRLAVEYFRMEEE